MSKFLALIFKYLNQGDPEWIVRRRMSVGTLIFGMFCICDGAWFETDHGFANELITEGFSMIKFVIGVYVAGAITDDHLQRISPGATLAIPGATSLKKGD